MATAKRLILIIGATGTRRDELFTSISQVSRYQLLGVAATFVDAVRLVSRHNPFMVLIDFTAPDAWTILRQVKSGWPHIVCVVLASNPWYKKHALALGADLALTAIQPSDPWLLSALDSIDSRKRTAVESSLAIGR